MPKIVIYWTPGSYDPPELSSDEALEVLVARPVEDAPYADVDLPCMTEDGILAEEPHILFPTFHDVDPGAVKVAFDAYEALDIYPKDTTGPRRVMNTRKENGKWVY